MRIVTRTFAASFLARSHRSEAFCSLSTILLASPWSPNCSEKQVSLYFLNNQFFFAGQFVAHVCYCSEVTELFDGNGSCEEPIPRLCRRHRSVKTIFLFLCFFKSPRSKALDPRNRVCPLSLMSSIMSSVSDSIPFSLRFVRVGSVPLLFSSKPKKRPMSVRESFRIF